MTRAPERIRTALRDALETQWKRRVVDELTLDLPFPISTNRLWRPVRGTMVRTARYKTWRRAAGNMINAQQPGRIKGEFRAFIVLERSRLDADNSLKCLMDILQECGVIENDKFAKEIRVGSAIGIKGARVTLTAIEDSSSLSPARRVAA